jgi:glutamyl-tRNA synthetase
MLNDEMLGRMIPLAQPRLNQLTDFVPMTAFLFDDRLDYDFELLVKGVDEPGRVLELLWIARWEMEKLAGWSAEGVRDVFTRMSEVEELKFKKLLGVFFVAISGKKVSLPLFDTMELLGRDMCLRRLQYAVELLEQNGISMGKKKLKKFVKSYEFRYTGGGER